MLFSSHEKDIFSVNPLDVNVDKYFVRNDVWVNNVNLEETSTIPMNQPTNG
jgi:hypothetical protein